MDPHDLRIARYRHVILGALSALEEGAGQKTLHRLRTHLRRMQALLELMGEDRKAEETSRWISRLSRLRTLQVLRGYLSDTDARARDRRKVRKRIRQAQAALRKKRVYEKIERFVRDETHIPGATPNELDRRLAGSRSANTESLRDLAADAAASPKRKRLHALRLKIKSIRYQEEWARTDVLTSDLSHLIRQLRRMQSILGAYEDLAEFRQLARKMGLDIRTRITKDWRRARRRARRIQENLEPVVEALAALAGAGRRPLQLVPDASQNPAGSA